MQVLEEKKFRLIADEPDFLVIDKAAGVSMHRKLDSGLAGLADQLATALGFDRLWTVHRLDEVTSGLVILAKSSEAAARFGAMFEQKQVDKLYVAIADGKPSKKQGRLYGDLEKTRGGNYRLGRGRDNPADTRFYSYSIAPGRRLYLLRPYTGKTHQLRVSMKALGTPILGDSRYNPQVRQEAQERCYLHAWCLRFDYEGPRSYRCLPRQGEAFTSAPCEAVLNKLDPWELPWPS